MLNTEKINNILLLVISTAFCLIVSCKKEPASVPVFENQVKSPDTTEVEVSEVSLKGSTAPTEINNAVTGPYSWKLPKEWAAQPASGMRLATIVIPQSEGDNLSASVTEFGGSLAGNINRWRGQIGLNPLEEAKVAESLERVETKLGYGYIALLINPDSVKKAMLAAIIPRPSGRSIFLKINGPAQSLKEIIDDFRVFTQSVSESD